MNVVATLTLITSGTLYAFGAYQIELSRHFGLTVTESCYLIAIAHSVSFLSHPLFGYVGKQCLPRTNLFLSGILIGFGYCMMALPSTSKELLLLYYICIGCGTCLCYQTVTKLYPSNGLLDPLIGFNASALIFAGVYYFLPNIVYYFITVGISCFCLNVCGALVLKPEVVVEEYSPLPFQEPDDASECSYDAVEAGIIQNTPISIREPSIEIVLQDVSCFDYMESYVIAYSMFSLVGATLMYISFIGVITTSLHSKLATEHVLLFSTCALLSRVLVNISRQTAHKCVILLLSSLCIWSGLFMSLESNLIIATCLLGLGYGALWTIAILLTAEYFGNRSFDWNWGIMSIMPGISSLLVAYLFTKVYEHHAIHGKCVGRLCFERSIEITMLSSIFAIFSIIALVIRRLVYVDKYDSL